MKSLNAPIALLQAGGRAIGCNPKRLGRKRQIGDAGPPGVAARWQIDGLLSESFAQSLRPVVGLANALVKLENGDVDMVLGNPNDAHRVFSANTARSSHELPMPQGAHGKGS
ncbi:hypothetical protein HFO68_31755 [Rhizobium laguerreae]|uniref:hypothetical protein n=1 Tax=Rhizobium laguerreae TaxID=1076926 RepID=UPI001C8FB356|nr:hypothetical protein [Rhizobium laguerreae]MBY3095682.1 hypothetical protein [Rhizobium laguerreae]MBY3102528.1 hypothetical protein [Rhizobium laguerreae]MBY3109082.1 hypothetical protein [Rhizobium laguerreae]MBY3129981.1 hypothetical protein [Rhizobium laguerreae]MBY3143977.1 hypothetical protein [Rhizobium laguerreae]